MWLLNLILFSQYVLTVHLDSPVETICLIELGKEFHSWTACFKI